MPLTVAPFQETDFPSVQKIYRQGIDTGDATFQQKAKSWSEWDNSHHPFCRIVAVKNEHIVGWAALSPISSRAVYAGIAEVSIYVDNTYKQQGIGQALLAQLITDSEQHGIWTLQAGIFPENIGSIKLHENNGFRQIGTREKLGKMNNIWRDVVLLERRSHVVGV